MVSQHTPQQRDGAMQPLYWGGTALEPGTVNTRKDDPFHEENSCAKHPQIRTGHERERWNF